MSNITYGNPRIPCNLSVCSLTASCGISGNLYGTASYAISASYAQDALSASYADVVDGYHHDAFAKLNEENTFTENNIFSTVTASSALFLDDIIVLGTASIATVNTINQTSLLVGDKYITILSGAADHQTLDESGILWGSGSIGDPTQGPLGENAYIKYRSIDDRLEIFPGLNISGTLSSSNGISGSFFGDGSGLTNLPGGISSVSTEGNISGDGTSGNPIILIDDVSVNTLTASSGLFVEGQTYLSGGLKIKISNKTSNYLLNTSSDYVVVFSGSNLTGTLPAASTCIGSTFIIKNKHTTPLYVTSSAGKIDNSGELIISLQYHSYTLVSDGIDWNIV